MGRKERRAKERQERKESIRMTPDRIYELKQKMPGVRERKLDLQEHCNGDGNQYRPRCLPGLQDIFTYNFQSGAAGNGPGKI